MMQTPNAEIRAMRITRGLGLGESLGRINEQAKAMRPRIRLMKSFMVVDGPLC